MTGRLEDKVAIITGAATGIGRAGARLFAQEGARVVVADRNAPEAEKTVAMIKENGGDAIFVETDVSKADQVQNMVAKALEQYGMLDVLVNDAGILIRTGARLAEIEDLEWDLTLNTNLRGVFYGCKYAIPHMLEQSKGAIVNMSSVTGLIGGRSGAPYCASKHGVIGLTKAVALEYAPQRIRVHAGCPAVLRPELAERLLLSKPELANHVPGFQRMARTGPG